jgi:hypothetical protein
MAHMEAAKAIMVGVTPRVTKMLLMSVTICNPKEFAIVFVATACLLLTEMSLVKFARSTGTSQASAGGVMVMMMMTHTLMRKVRIWPLMALTQIGL